MERKSALTIVTRAIVAVAIGLALALFLWLLLYVSVRAISGEGLRIAFESTIREIGEDKIQVGAGIAGMIVAAVTIRAFASWLNRHHDPRLAPRPCDHT